MANCKNAALLAEKSKKLCKILPLQHQKIMNKKQANALLKIMLEGYENIQPIEMVV